MRVIELRNGWGLEHLHCSDRPDPRPGPNDVVVRIEAASINYRDYVLVRGGYGKRAGTLPLIPISDAAGIVVDVGTAVHDVKVGERVCPLFHQTWMDGEPQDEISRAALGGPLDGVMREYMLLPAHGVAKLPPHLESTEAATLPCAAITAWSAIVTQGRTKPGDAVVVQGTGGVSLFALQFAKLCGAFVICTSSSDAKLERALACGADATINREKEPHWGRVVRRILGCGADQVVDVGGSESLCESIRCVRSGGIVSVIGVLSGRIAELNLAAVAMPNIRLQGVSVGGARQFGQMARAIRQHKLRPVLDARRFAFHELRSALEYLARGAHIGKVVITF